MWHEDAFGTSPFGSDVYDSRPHNTTAKALLLNSTKQWTFSGASHDRTRTHQGWGRPDLRTLYDDAGRLFIVDESDVLTQGGGSSYTLDVPAGEPEFRVTLVYADPPGTTSSTMHRINDLSLRVTSPGGTVYWGNQGLLSSMYSSPGGVSNVKDTVEQVIVQNPTAGTWTVDVLADEVNQDAHLETPGLDADYALVARPVIGGGGGGEPKDTIDLSGVTNPVPGLPYAYNFQYAPPSVDAWLLASSSITGTTYQGHDFDVSQPVYVVDHVVSTTTGVGSFLVTFPGSLSGTTWFLEVAADGRVDIYLGGTELRLDGEPVRGPVSIAAEALGRGAVLELANRVVLLLHRVSPDLERIEPCGLVGDSDAIQHLRGRILDVADLDVPVLLRGASGTGKELVARAIHELGPRRNGPQQCVNMAELGPTLAAASLFGSTRGAFTGATEDREGLFVAADGGTPVSYTHLTLPTTSRV